MRVKIYRGTHQIGGCVTEIRTDKARILIDFGSELNDASTSLVIEGVNRGVSSCDAVFFTHYHGDHIGMMDEINVDIPIYMGELSKELLLVQNNRCHLFDHEKLKNSITFHAGKPVFIKDIKITPFMIDHSAFDAYMFLVEADGKTLLHTGDFRTHGYRGKGLDYVIENYLPDIDCLIGEGTALNRDIQVSMTEQELSARAKEIFKENKYVFVICASTNIDRIAGFYSAVPQGKYCLCDEYQMSILEIVKQHSKCDLYSFDKMLTYGKNLKSKLVDRGFCMFVRAGSPYFKTIIEEYKEYRPLLLYSMWKGYLEQDRIKKFVEGYDMISLHTSGHVDPCSLTRIINKVRPKIIIPVHTETPDEYRKLNISSQVIVLNDGEELEI